jgi:hypothetical protein
MIFRKISMRNTSDVSKEVLGGGTIFIKTTTSKKMPLYH